MARLTLPGARLFYVDAGTGGPPIVFIHGVACAHDDWQAQLDCFRPRRRVVACDLRGHGVSMGDPAHCDIETYGADVAALLRALDLKAVVLVGHSMGVRVVLQALSDAPQRVAGIVLVEGSRVGAGDPDVAEQTIRQRIDLVGYLAFIRALFADMFLAGSDPVLQQRIVERALDLPEAIGSHLIPRFIGWDARSLEAILANVAVPLLAIQSTYVNPQRVRAPLEPGDSSPWLELILRSVPSAQIDIVNGAGHFVMIEQPHVVNQRIEMFLAELVRPN